MEELELFVKNRGQSKDKVVPEETLAKLVHVFTKKSYQIKSEFNNSVLKKVKHTLEADTSEDHSTFFEEGIELIRQKNKLLVISDKYGWETGVAYMLDPIAENSDDERKIEKAWKEAKLLKEEKKNNKRARDRQFRKRHFLVTETPVSHLCLMILSKGSAVGVGNLGTMPGPAEPQFLHTGQVFHQPHNNSLVSHEKLNFVLKTQEDNFVDLQNDFLPE